jgi:hypothetical protein
MKKLFTAVAIFIAATAWAQDATIQELEKTATKTLEEDTSHKQGWKTGAMLNLGLAQGGTSNWAAGGEKSSFSLNGHLNLFANWKEGKNKWTNNLDLFYAVIKTTSQGMRKNDDRIDYFSKYVYMVKPKVGLGVVGTFRTQFANGYNYDETPKVKTSAFMAPAYLTIAPGVDWQPCTAFSLFVSPISARWTLVSKSNIELAPSYGLDTGKTTRFEAGAYLSANYKKEIFKNVEYTGRLDLYSNYLHNPQNVDVFWTNLIGLKVNKWLKVTYSFDLIYDDDIRIFGPGKNATRTQTKTLLSVGFTGKL